jgi:MinD superfamily P-loop ATPase
MRIAIASGKGGTGKTTIAVNLARVLSKREIVQYIDCDVEEPNGHLFLKPEISETITAVSLVPQVNAGLCIHCGACSNICQFHAIASLPKLTLVFPELCHSCGGCMRVCPEKAISEVARPIGIVESGTADAVLFVNGRLNVGEAMSPPLIRMVQEKINNAADTVIIDAPPGTSCPVIAAVKLCDIVILVTEPTSFGLNDLILAVDMVRMLNIPLGVVINRSDMGDNRVEEYCKKEEITIFGRIPHNRRLAEAYSRGEIAVDILPETRHYFEEIISAVKMEVIL